MSDREEFDLIGNTIVYSVFGFRNDRSHNPKNVSFRAGQSSTSIYLPPNPHNRHHRSLIGSAPRQYQEGWIGTITVKQTMTMLVSSNRLYRIICEFVKSQDESWAKVAGDIYRIYRSEAKSHLWNDFILFFYFFYYFIFEIIFEYLDVNRTILDLVEYKCINLGANRSPVQTGTFNTPFLHQMVNSFLMGGASPILYEELISEYGCGMGILI